MRKIVVAMAISLVYCFGAYTHDRDLARQAYQHGYIKFWSAPAMTFPRSEDIDYHEGVNNVVKKCCYEATTIILLRVVESMRQFHMDADAIQREFLNGIGDYERKLAKREGIELYDPDHEGSE